MNILAGKLYFILHVTYKYFPLIKFIILPATVNKRDGVTLQCNFGLIITQQVEVSGSYRAFSFSRCRAKLGCAEEQLGAFSRLKLDSLLSETFFTDHPRFTAFPHQHFAGDLSVDLSAHDLEPGDLVITKKIYSCCCLFPGISRYSQ